VRQAVNAGVKREQAWAMGSLAGATRFGRTARSAASAAGRRADVVLLDDNLEPINTWYGGELMVEERKITPALEPR